MKKAKVLRVRVTTEDLQILESLAEIIGWSRSGVVRALIRSAKLGPQPVPVAGPLRPEGVDARSAGNSSGEEV